MKYCLNTTKAVINIGGHTVIAPTKGAWVDPEVRGVQDLIDRELLVEGDAPQDDTEPKKGAASGKKAQGDSKEPSTVKDLKTWLDAQGAQYSASASKAELQGLYEALKANAVVQGGADANGGAGGEGQ
ncbi:hypothetical protein [Achromobacter insolitus]|uniref:hypothetical protein n=1 Tax=Achromobacter insolitus TaxID=217204 RepID=UPI0028A6C211|nr:hypothetical protein [Achromobacter insolitus]